jgi:hypothetical protein
MTDRRRKTIVFGLCAIALIWAFYTVIGQKHKKILSVTAQGQASTVEAEPPRIPADTRKLDSLDTAYETKPWGKDPFYHDVKSDPPLDVQDTRELHLLGILYRHINSQALINKRVVTVGDKLEGFEVMEITRNSVTLNDGRKTITLRLEKESS